MIRYLIIFAIVFLLSLISKFFINKSKFISSFFSLTCIIILSIFAALRGYSVGTDIHVYGWEYFYESAGFKTLFSYIASHDFVEPFYYGLNYIIYRLFGDIHYFFFAMQFIISALIFAIAYDEEKKKKGVFCIYILSYLFIWYNSSLNIMRQSLALIFVLYAFKYLEKMNIKKYIFFVFIGFLFHSSAIVCLSFPLLNKISKSKNAYKYIVIISIVLLGIFSSLRPMVNLLIHIFPFFTKYFNYILYENGNMITNYAIFKVLFLLVVLAFSKPVLTEHKNNILYYFIILDLVFYFSSMFIKFGYRLSYFFLPFYIYLFPRLDSGLKNYKGRSFYRLVLVLLLMIYWYYRFVIVGYDGTIPYVFYWE